MKIAHFCLLLFTSGICNVLTYARHERHFYRRKRLADSLSSQDSASSESESSSGVDILGPEENPKCNDSEDWPLLYPTCTGLKQSPVDIKDSEVRMSAGPVPALCWANYRAVPESMTLTNAGYTLHLTGTWRENEIPSVSCGVLNGTYIFSQWHCHWGKTDEQGSDHTFNGKHYPLECHLVHFRSDLKTYEKAATVPDGVAVVTYFFQIGNMDVLPNILKDALPQLAKNDSVSIAGVPLSTFAPAFHHNYAVYKGSLTTPPCSESVVWIINTEIRLISPVMIKKFRQVAQSSECMKNNFRETQDINDRHIILVPTNKHF